WLKRRLLTTRRDFPRFLSGWTINQEEAIGNCTRDRIETDNTGLHELSLVGGFQANDLAASSVEIDRGGQTVERQKIEALAEAFTFLGCGLDSLREGLEDDSIEPNK